MNKTGPNYTPDLSRLAGNFKNLDLSKIQGLYDQHSGTQGFDLGAFLDYLGWYDSYLGKISPYQGTDYYERLLNNPYASFQTYSPGSIGEAALGELGFTGGMNSFYNSRMTSAEEEFNKILTEMQANQYNSPVAQASRDRAAGLNPALSGELNGGEPFSAIGPDENNPLSGSPMAAEDIGQIANIASLPMNFVQSCVSLLGTFQDLGIKMSDAGLKEIALNSAARQEASDEAGDLVPPISPGHLESPDIASGFLSYVSKKGAIYKSRSARKAMKRARGNLFYDEGANLPSTAFSRAYSERLKSLSGDTVDIAKNFSMPGYDSHDVISFSNKLAEEVTNIQIGSAKVAKDLKDIEFKLKLSSVKSVQKQQDADYARASNELVYETTLNDLNAPSLQAQAETAGFDAAKIANQVAKSKAEFDRMIQDSKNSIARLVHSTGGKAGRVATILLPGMFNTVDTFADRFLDHFDGVLDLIINPAGKVLGKALGGSISNSIK